MSAKKITRGSSNVFADLGFADAEEMQTKARLAHATNSILEQRGLTIMMWRSSSRRSLGLALPDASVSRRTPNRPLD
ncbi:MAG: XRE family transcriptional regulator [Terricaulis sp.]